MAYYRCGGANHYDEGYSAGYSAGRSKGAADQKNAGTIDKTLPFSGAAGSHTVSFAGSGITRIDAIIKVTAVNDDGSSFAGGVAGINFSGTTVSYWVQARFSPSTVYITARQYKSRD